MPTISLVRDDWAALEYAPAKYAAGADIGGGVIDARDSLAAADVAAASVGVRRLFFGPGTYYVASSFAIGSPVDIAPGAVIRPASGVTVTFTGAVHAPLCKWLDDSLGGSLGFTLVSQFHPEWWGAATGTATDTTKDATNGSAIKKAVDAAAAVNGEVVFQRGIYRTTAIVFPQSAGAHTVLTLRGAGAVIPVDGTTYTQHANGTVLLSVAAGSLLSITKATAGNTTYRIADLSLFGANDVAVTASGIRIDGGGFAIPRVILERVGVGFFLGGKGIWLSACESWRFDTVWTQYNDVNIRLDTACNAGCATNVACSLSLTCGLWMENGQQSCTWVGGRLEANPKGAIYINGGIGLTFDGTHIEGNGATSGWAVKVEGTAGRSNQHITFRGISTQTTTDKFVLVGVATGTTWDVRIEGGYSSGVGSPKVTVSDVYCLATRIIEYAAPNAEVTDLGIATVIQYQGTTNAPAVTTAAIDLGNVAAAGTVETANQTLTMGPTSATFDLTDGTWVVTATSNVAVPVGLAPRVSITGATTVKCGFGNYTAGIIASAPRVWTIVARKK